MAARTLWQLAAPSYVEANLVGDCVAREGIGVPRHQLRVGMRVLEPSLLHAVLLVAALAPLPSIAAPAPAEVGLVPANDPTAIVGGLHATPCQWPSAVAILEDDATPVMCTGSLIHPGVVMTAAHCISPERPVVAVGFGEHGQSTGVPARTVEVIECVGNPEYYAGPGADVGYCLLADPVFDVPIVPLMSGCEVDALVEGTEVVIVGFGATYGELIDKATGEVATEGIGPKRWTTQRVDFIDESREEINLSGPNGSQSACFGDSGGPGLVRLADGSWRVFGTGGHLYDPGGLPPPLEKGNLCGTGAAYGFAPFVLDWLEAETGIDLTPCWDDGVWAPNPECSTSPLAPDEGFGFWATGCSGGPVGGGEPVCEGEPQPPPPPPPEPTSGTDDFGSDDFGDETMSFTTGPTPPPSTSGPGPIPTDPIPPLPGGTGSSSDTGEDAPLDNAGLIERGCSCTSTTPPGGDATLWLLGLAMLGLRRRSR